MARRKFFGRYDVILVIVANLPATAIPTGRFIEAMPIGLQAVGPYLEDRTTLRFAQLPERALGG